MITATNSAGDERTFGEREEAFAALSQLGTPEEVVAAKWWFEHVEITVGEAIVAHWWPVLVEGVDGPTLKWEWTGWKSYEALSGKNPYQDRG